MLIKSITIENFRSYYGASCFELSDGLTLIIGGNGDGKTTFYEALSWFFDGKVRENLPASSILSAKKKEEMAEDESSEVSVSVVFTEDDCQYSLKRSCIFKKCSNGSVTVANSTFNGQKTYGVEKVLVDGSEVIGRCFDASMRQYSMFKGETDLNVFNNPQALQTLVNTFSNVKMFDRFEEMTVKFHQDCSKSYSNELKKDDKCRKKSQELDEKISNKKQELCEKRQELRRLYGSRDKLEESLADIDKTLSDRDEYNVIKTRIENFKSQIHSKEGNIKNNNLSILLLDSKWILLDFARIYREFSDKMAAFSKQEREEIDEFKRRIDERRGELKAIEKLKSDKRNFAPLPWNTPGDWVLKEMIADRVCKVCGRPVEEGSEAYNYMVQKLEDYRKHLEVQQAQDDEIKKLDKEKLFAFKYVETINDDFRLSGAERESVSHIREEVSDCIKLVERRRREIREVQGKLDKEEQDMSDFLARAHASKADFETSMNDYKYLSREKEDKSVAIANLEGKINTLTDELECAELELSNLDPQGSKAQRWKKSNECFKNIASAFRRAKEVNQQQFLSDLESRANSYLEKLNVDDFHGRLQLRYLKQQDVTRTRLYSSDGETVVDLPSGSQETIMYLSILFAISDLSEELKEDKHPLVFDAATSSFGEVKAKAFYEVIDSLGKQCVIVTKDFMSKGELMSDEINRLSCSNVYVIRKAEGFDPNNLSTICTKVIKVK